jgi:hypothetical protein
MARVQEVVAFRRNDEGGKRRRNRQRFLDPSTAITRRDTQWCFRTPRRIDEHLCLNIVWYFNWRCYEVSWQDRVVNDDFKLGKRYCCRSANNLNTGWIPAALVQSRAFSAMGWILAGTKPVDGQRTPCSSCSRTLATRAKPASEFNSDTGVA